MSSRTRASRALTLGGGIGWLMRKHGATVDSLLSAEVVTAEGDVITASAKEHPDLFWALHSLSPRVLAGPIFYALEDAPDLPLSAATSSPMRRTS
jgi:hypothetical protein